MLTSTPTPALISDESVRDFDARFGCYCIPAVVDPGLPTDLFLSGHLLSGLRDVGTRRAGGATGPTDPAWYHSQPPFSTILRRSWRLPAARPAMPASVFISRQSVLEIQLRPTGSRCVSGKWGGGGSGRRLRTGDVLSGRHGRTVVKALFRVFRNTKYKNTQLHKRALHNALFWTLIFPPLYSSYRCSLVLTVLCINVLTGQLNRTLTVPVRLLLLPGAVRVICSAEFCPGG